MIPSTKKEFIERIKVHAQKMLKYPQLERIEKPVTIRLPKVPEFDINEIL